MAMKRPKALSSSDSVTNREQYIPPQITKSGTDKDQEHAHHFLAQCHRLHGWYQSRAFSDHQKGRSDGVSC
jgi:hypothetical protein